MPTAFLQPDSQLLRACEHAIVLTSNERLRRELVRAYDARQQKKGRRAWRSANVHSLDGYLLEQYAQLRGIDPHLPGLLSPEAELLMFARFAPPAAADLGRTALQAWSLLHDWNIPLTEAAFGHTDNGRVFLAWASRVRAYLEESRCLTRAELPALLSSQYPNGSDTARAIVCLGFESVTQAVRDYFKAVAARGPEVEFREPDRRQVESLVRTEFDRPAGELNAIAQWCRRILSASNSANRQSRIGVVIPDLTNRYHQVVRQFGAELEAFPGQDQGSIFDVAAGLSLSQQPIWRDARRFLDLCLDRIAVDDLSSLLNSRYLDLPDPLTVTLPPELPTRIALWQLISIAESPLFDQLNRLCPPPESNDSLGAWINRFSTLLSAAGWSGAGAASGQYQAWEQLHAALRRAAAAPAASIRCNAAKALDLVEQTLDARLFAPRTAAAPVQIMGYLETTGLRFTHLWIAGMQDSAWPGPANPNPFIPIATQRRAGVPRIDQRSELDFAQSRIEHWLASSKTLVISHVVDDGEAQHLASPLTEEIDLHPTGSVIKGWRQRSHPYLTPRANLLERFDDSTGTRLSGGRHRGGSGLLRDQATCPFRAWAIHRLRLREVRQPHAFPDALDRGNLVHEALHGLLLPFTEPRDDRRYPDEVNPAALAAAADSALEARYGRFPSLFRSRERARLISLLASWVELERERGEFQVVELESDAELLVAELQLRLRLDRVDQVGDRRVIIDYKTGGIQPGRLLSPRLQEPQLPAYAVSHEGVAAVLFGQAVDPNPRLAGLAAEDLNAEPARLEPLPVGGWQELASTWRAQLETLASEFGSGHAAVDPVNAEACQHCHLQSLCRIRDEQPDR